MLVRQHPRVDNRMALGSLIRAWEAKWQWGDTEVQELVRHSDAAGPRLSPRALTVLPDEAGPAALVVFAVAVQRHVDREGRGIRVRPERRLARRPIPDNKVKRYGRSHRVPANPGGRAIEKGRSALSVPLTESKVGFSSRTCTVLDVQKGQSGGGGGVSPGKCRLDNGLYKGLEDLLPRAVKSKLHPKEMHFCINVHRLRLNGNSRPPKKGNQKRKRVGKGRGAYCTAARVADKSGKVLALPSPHMHDPNTMRARCTSGRKKFNQKIKIPAVAFT